MELGYERLLVVHGAPGIDEVSVSGTTEFVEVAGGSVEAYRLSPQDLGLKEHSVAELRVTSPRESAERILRVLKGKGREADIDFIAANAGAAIYVYGLAKDLRDGVERAIQVIKEGRAARFLEEVLKANADCTSETGSVRGGEP
jgi:anthranilate phosphoribosyltransferase